MIVDTQKFRLHLKTETLGHWLHFYERVDSTNRLAMEYLREGAPEGTTILAEQQTGGRGSNGRSWQSLPGGLYLSVVLTPEVALEDVFQLTLVAAFGVAQSLCRLTGTRVRLKWPNDLVVEAEGGLAKAGGILTETRVQGGRLVGAVVGVGLNWDNPVPEGGIRLRPLARRPLDLAMVAAAVLLGIEEAYQLWQTRGISRIVAGYERYLVNLGQAVEVPGHDGPGRIIGIDGQGALRVMFLNGSEALLSSRQLRLGYRR
ncbi:biotin/acetyl-CoA-carboxylase ligase [Gloeobacter kilaueensis JS1]|uniref:Biotin/acetyl-CoA-carboxylase ligase n=1 Tax=Gloeobacter kilaueensis (strain ATCC BAA-2537 / CCAP 1431/1 / ULC 316 / JS1) TaxID=1183438 RepID=U5QNR1_GLOK1|nr:biotin--[acetyl-CoA-carboxylase] ligase [Gloeobacter kilaueensis]AGY60632.1 biotin/acetyl-CoA-carboxylase ligase [Gloeobacter kilaueensis JS1]